MPKVVPSYKAKAHRRILEAATEVFAVKGFHASTMDDIAKRVGVSKGALYLYFKSKEQLFRAILDSEETFLTDFLSRALRIDYLEHNAATIFDQVAKAQELHLALTYDLMAEASRNPKLLDIIRQHTKREIRVAEDFIRVLRKKKVVRNDIDLRTQSLGITGLFLGLMLLSPMVRDREDIRKAWADTVKMLVLPANPPPAKAGGVSDKLRSSLEQGGQNVHRTRISPQSIHPKAESRAPRRNS